MALKNKVQLQTKPIEIDEKNDTSKGASPAGSVPIEARLEELESRRRNPVLHWIAFVVSLFSLLLLSPGSLALADRFHYVVVLILDWELLPYRVLHPQRV